MGKFKYHLNGELCIRLTVFLFSFLCPFSVFLVKNEFDPKARDDVNDRRFNPSFESSNIILLQLGVCIPFYFSFLVRVDFGQARTINKIVDINSCFMNFLTV